VSHHGLYRADAQTARFAVVFDVDGVLVDSAQAHRCAWQRLGAEVGVPFSDSLFQATFGQKNENIIAAWLGSQIPPERACELGERKEALYRDLLRQHRVRVYPGVQELFARLRAAGAAIAVASSGPRLNVDLVLALLGVGGLVDASVAAEEVTAGKPDPEVFLRAAALVGVPPSRCAVVEDSIHGIEAAKRAGMLAIGIRTTAPGPILAAAGADLVVAEIGSLRPEQILSLLAGRQSPEAQS